jgi:hypothetical protein
MVGKGLVLWTSLAAARTSNKPTFTGRIGGDCRVDGRTLGLRFSTIRASMSPTVACCQDLREITGPRGNCPPPPKFAGTGCRCGTFSIHQEPQTRSWPPMPFSSLISRWRRPHPKSRSAPPSLDWGGAPYRYQRSSRLVLLGSRSKIHGVQGLNRKRTARRAA